MLDSRLTAQATRMLDMARTGEGRKWSLNVLDHHTIGFLWANGTTHNTGESEFAMYHLGENLEENGMMERSQQDPPCP